MTEHPHKNFFDNMEVKTMSSNLNAFLEALAIIAEQDTENTVKNIRRIQCKLEKKKATDVAASVANPKKSLK